MSLVGLDLQTFLEERRRPYGPQRPPLGWPFWALLAVFLLVMLLGVNEQWLFGHHGWNGARRGMAGINYVRHGFLETRFGPVENFGPASRSEFQFYWHHPVLIHVLTGVSFRLLGVHEWAARLVPIALSTLSFGLLYGLALRWWGRRGAVATAVAFTFLPLQAFYGKMVNHEPLVLALGITLVWLLVRFHEARRWRHVVAAGLLALLGSFSDWPFFLILAAVGLFELLREIANWREDRDLRFVVVLSVAALAGAVAVVYYLIQFSGDVGGFKKLFTDRSGAEGGSYGPVALWDRRDWYWLLFGPIATVAGGLWLVTLPARAALRRLGPADALIGGSFLVGTAWLVLFTQAAHIHEYWVFYLVPFLALSSAWALRAVGRAAGRVVAAVVRRAGRRVPALVVLGLGCTAYAASGVENLLERQRTPSDVGREAPEFRFRNAILGEWLGQQLRPDDRLLVQDSLPLPFQLAFYLRVNADRVVISPTFRKPHVRRDHRFLVLDRQHLPESDALRILRDLARRYPVTMVDRYALFDLKAADNEGQQVRAFRFAFSEPSPLWLWFESLVYPPFAVEESRAEAFLWALHLGLDDAARRLAAQLERPPVLRAEGADAEQRRLRDWVAWYDAARLLRRPTTPADAALRHALGQPLGVRFGAVAALDFIAFTTWQGDRTAATLILRGLPAAGASAEPLTGRVHRRPVAPFPRLRRLRFFGGTERVWRQMDPSPAAWRPGFLAVDTYPLGPEAFPQEVLVHFESKEKVEKRRLRARAQAARDAVLLGGIESDAERRHDPDAPFAWVPAEDCAPPRMEGGAAVFPAACRAKLQALYDLRTDLTLTGDDTLRVEGVRYAGQARGRMWYQLFFRAPAGLRHDWRLTVGFPGPRADKRPPGFLADPHGRVDTSRWERGAVVAVTWPAVGKPGPHDVWLRAEREDRSGGRLPVAGSESRDTAVVPVPLGLRER